ncbi:MAG: hypothetical protein H0W01_06800, partial [Pseudonocardiales bacterium]|nr:hypothetical protein [Pseudonocardiales bacterium]
MRPGWRRWRGEIVATALVVVLAVVGVIALWPRGAAEPDAAATAVATTDPAPDDSA